jgi:hypothetical protein
MQELKPNEQRAKYAMILIWMMLGFEILSFISGYLQYELLQNAKDGIEISLARADANDLRERIINGVNFVVYIVSVVTFIKWFRRAYFNLHIKVKNLSFTEDSAAKSWFFPILNLYRPFNIMKELYIETKNILTKNEISFNQDFSTKYLGFWWTLWIINNVLGQFIFRLSLNADTIDEFIISTKASMISNIIGIPLALLAVKVIKDYSEVEPLLREINDVEQSIN